jgi:hypothetical protein
MMRYSDRGGQMNYSQRFRYGNLVQMHAKYREMFRKRMNQREEGRVQRHFGAAAREIEKERVHSRPARTEPVPFAVSCKDPEREPKKVEELYSAFLQAKAQAGDSTDGLTIESFQRFVRQKTDQLKNQKNASEVEYVVSLEGKHAKLIARVK